MAFDSSEYGQLLPLLDQAGSATVLTHVYPDGDGVGSGLALTSFLRQKDLDVRFLITHPLPAGLRFLSPGGRAAVYEQAGCSAFVRKCDLLFTVDNSSVERLGPIEADVRASRAHKVCIDHHLVRNEFWDLNLIDEQACATGEMIHDCIETLGGQIDRPMAEALYVAIWTDTGGFRFPKTSGKIHRMVAGLLEKGIEPHRVYREINERQSRQGIRLLAEALLRIKFGVEGRLAWVTLPASLLAECGAEEEDTSEVINHILSIEGVEIGLLFRETGSGGTKISLRSKPQHDVNSLALLHGGGGHKNASGAVVEDTLDACEQQLVLQAESLLR